MKDTLANLTPEEKDNIEKLRVMDARQRYLYWVTERESIRLKREQGLPKPWTVNPIMRRYKFCNVRRMDDRVSQWLLNNWLQPYYDHPNMLTACTLARFFNNPEALNAIGFPKRWDPDRCKKILDARAARKLTNFNGAYIVTGSLGGTKIDQVLYKIADPLHKAKIKPDTSSLEALIKTLNGRKGIGSFLAGQIACDYRHGASGTWTDVLTFAPMGPGSHRGMNRFHDRPKQAPIKPDQFQRELADLFQFLRDNTPKSIWGRLEAIDVQNTLCEFWKFERTLTPGLATSSRPKCTYPGV